MDKCHVSQNIAFRDVSVYVCVYSVGYHLFRKPFISIIRLDEKVWFCWFDLLLARQPFRSIVLRSDLTKLRRIRYTCIVHVCQQTSAHLLKHTHTQSSISTKWNNSSKKNKNCILCFSYYYYLYDLCVSSIFSWVPSNMMDNIVLFLLYHSFTFRSWIHFRFFCGIFKFISQLFPLYRMLNWTKRINVLELTGSPYIYLFLF